MVMAPVIAFDAGSDYVVGIEIKHQIAVGMVNRFKNLFVQQDADTIRTCDKESVAFHPMLPIVYLNLLRWHCATGPNGQS